MSTKSGKIILEGLLNHVGAEGIMYVTELLQMLVNKSGEKILALDINEKSFSHLGLARAKYDGQKLLLQSFIAEISKARKRVD